MKQNMKNIFLCILVIAAICIISGCVSSAATRTETGMVTKTRFKTESNLPVQTMFPAYLKR